MANDARGKTLHGYLSNEDYALMLDATKHFGTNINRFVSASVRYVLHNGSVLGLVGHDARIPPEETMTLREIRELVAGLKLENEKLRSQLERLSVRGYQ